MTRHRVLLAALAAVVGILMPATALAQVRGRVTDSASDSPASGALVWLTGRTLRMTHADSAGNYEFENVTPGSYCLRVETPGYDPARVCITVSAGASLIVDLPLTLRPVAIEPLIIESRRSIDEHRTDAKDSLRITPLSQRLAVIGTRSASLAAMQLADLSNVQLPDPTAGRQPHALYMWGSRGERGRVLLDGASLSAPLHLGAVLPPVDPDVIERADVHTGGISPRYDGGTAFIMDFATRPAAARARTWGEVDLLASTIGAESPINGRGRAMISARRVNDEIIDGIVPSRFGYGYSDALARADVRIGDGGVHVTAFATNESVGIPRDLGEDRASWENRVATVSWNSDNNGDVRAATLSASRGVADLPLLTAPGGHLEATLDRLRATASRQWDTGALRWDAGVEVEHLVFRRQSSALADPVSGTTGAVECTDALPCSRARATLASAFAGIRLEPLRNLVLNVGARTMYDTDAERVHVLSRFALTLVPAANYAFTLSAGQFSQPYVNEYAGQTQSDTGVHAGVRIARATHIELGAARQSSAFYLRANAWLRRYAGADTMTLARSVPGADVSLEYASGIGTLALSYSLSGGHEAGASIQHLAVAGLQQRYGRFQLDINAMYGSGLPLTSVVLEEPMETVTVLHPGGTIESLEASGNWGSRRNYTRVDASLGAEFTVGGSEPRAMIVPYVRLLNAFGEHQSLFYFQPADASAAPRALASLPAIPVFGIRWHF